jgi:hypothetical protein
MHLSVIDPDIKIYEGGRGLPAPKYLHLRPDQEKLAGHYI